MEVHAYLAKHELQQKVESALNVAVQANAPEPLSVIAAQLLAAAPSVILAVVGRQVFDSRGLPTVEAAVTTHRGTYGAIVPSGASTGIYEALELRDQDPAAFGGKGVGRAVANVNEVIAPALLGLDPTQQRRIDELMVQTLDGTQNEHGWAKTKLGANAILAVSMAVCKAGAAQAQLPLYRHIAALAGNTQLVLPVPSFNIINGGSHAGNKIAFQEFMVMPVGAKSFAEAMQIGCEVYHSLKTLTKAAYGKDAVHVGDEGGFAPPIPTVEDGVELIMRAIEACGHTDKCKLALDVAASEFFLETEEGTPDLYDLDFKNENNDGKERVERSLLLEMYSNLCRDYPFVSIEDPFDQDDWTGWQELTALKCCQVVGDDLTVTNVTRIQRAAESEACNCLLLKVNQIGSVTESMDAVALAKVSGWGVMASHRSGDTEETFIADLAVGLSCGQIKSGAPCRSERLAKYNQLLRIEEELGEEAVYLGEKLLEGMDIV